MSQNYPNNLSNGHASKNGHYAGEDFINHSQDDDEAEIDIRQILAVVLKNKWIVIGITLLGALLAFGYIKLSIPIYQSTGKIIISEPPNRYSMAGNDLSNLLMSSYGIGVGSSVENELEILNSRSFALRIADQLLEEKTTPGGALLPLLWWEYPTDSTVVDRLSVALRIQDQRLVQTTDKFSSIIQISMTSPSKYEAMRVINLFIDTYSEYSTSQNRQQAKAALDFLKKERERLEKQVAEDEDLMRDFMNEQGIVELTTQSKNVLDVLVTLESELKAAQVSLSVVDSSVDIFEEQLNKIIPGFAEKVSNTVAFQLQKIQFQLSELETERAFLLSRNPELRQNPEKSGRFIQLNQQIRVLKEEIFSISKTLLDDKNIETLGFLNNPEGGLVSRLVEFKNKLVELEIEKNQLQARIELLNKQIKEYDTFFDNLPENMVQMARLKRALLVNEQLFLTIAKQSAEMALWEQTQSGLARVVDYAMEAIRPIKPRKLVILVIGTFLGGVFSVGFVLFMFYTKKELDSVDLLRKTGLPVLSVIPDLLQHVKTAFDGKETIEVHGKNVSTGLVTMLDSISPSSEAYRRLQSNIMYSKPDNPYKVVLVTSSNKSEGKTTLASNLAITMAETGNKVLIMDCDFRRPRLHKVFGESASPGLIDLLFEGGDVHSYIDQSVVENVYVLTAGNRPPNPAEINRSHKLKTLIQTLKEEFDFIVIDTPPYGIITDAAPLIKQADGVVLVSKFNQTKKMELQHTLESLRRIDANIIGTCMTAYDAKKSSGYYYTDYYYQYAYESYNEYDKRED